jgi:phi LC3 family holin
MWWVGMIGVIGAPILAYTGMNASDITTWGTLGNLVVQVFSNPYLLGSVIMAILGAIGVTFDPTTTGISDSDRAMLYDRPNGD